MGWTKADKQRAQEVVHDFLASGRVKRIASGVADVEDLREELMEHCFAVEYPTPPLAVFRELLEREGVRPVDGDPSRYAGIALTNAGERGSR